MYLAVRERWVLARNRLNLLWAGLLLFALNNILVFLVWALSVICLAVFTASLAYVAVAFDVPVPLYDRLILHSSYDQTILVTWMACGSLLGAIGTIVRHAPVERLLISLVRACRVVSLILSAAYVYASGDLIKGLIVYACLSGPPTILLILVFWWSVEGYWFIGPPRGGRKVIPPARRSLSDGPFVFPSKYRSI